MSRKKTKKTAKEELPSFLLELTAIPEDVRLPPRATNSNHYLGPIFFGECHQFHPPLHSIELGTVRHVQKTYTAKENIQDLFLPKAELQENVEVSKVFKPLVKRKHFYSDPYSHRCPGIRRSFVPEIKLPVINLGETTSIIEGETVLEVPLCRIRRVLSRTPEAEFEFVKLTNIKEKKKVFMSYEEQVSHVHYAKEFITVTVTGPTIPRAITITKLPSKRKTQSEMTFCIKPKFRKSSEDGAETGQKKTEDEIQEIEFEVKKESVKEEELSTKEHYIGEGENEKEDDHQELCSTQNLAENEDQTAAVDGEDTTEELQGETEDTEINKETEECEERREDPDEEESRE